MQPQEELLAGDLGRRLPERGVGELILGKEPGPRRHGLGEISFEIGDAVAGQRRNHKDPVELLERR